MLGGLVLVLSALAVASVVYVVRLDQDTPAADPTPVEDRPSVAPVTPGQVVPLSDVTWYSLHGAQLPVSPTHGPRRTTGELASGFSHDPAGAVLAAINIAVRTSGLAGGESVFAPTIADQTTGDVEGYLAATRANYAELAVQNRVPAPVVIGYRIDPASTADDVRVQLLSRVTNPADPTQHALMIGALRVQWISGDWKLTVPTGAGKQVSEVPNGFSAMPGQVLSISG